MKITQEEMRERISAKGLKVTPQRLSVLSAVYKMDIHPTAEQIMLVVRKNNPFIAKGTIYHVLDTLVENNLIRRVKSDRDIMRYDGVLEHHHHLYCSECDVIEDYKDAELDALLHEYFKKKKLEGFHIEDVVLQIRGTFNKC